MNGLIAPHAFPASPRSHCSSSSYMPRMSECGSRLSGLGSGSSGGSFSRSSLTLRCSGPILQQHRWTTPLAPPSSRPVPGVLSKPQGTFTSSSTGTHPNSRFLGGEVAQTNGRICEGRGFSNLPRMSTPIGVSPGCEAALVESPVQRSDSVASGASSQCSAWLPSDALSSMGVSLGRVMCHAGYMDVSKKEWEMGAEMAALQASMDPEESESMVALGEIVSDLDAASGPARNDSPPLDEQTSQQYDFAFEQLGFATCSHAQIIADLKSPSFLCEPHQPQMSTPWALSTHEAGFELKILSNFSQPCEPFMHRDLFWLANNLQISIEGAQPLLAPHTAQRLPCTRTCTRHHTRRVPAAAYPAHCAQCNAHHALCTVHYALCTVHCALCTVHCALCTVHCVCCRCSSHCAQTHPQTTLCTP